MPQILHLGFWKTGTTGLQQLVFCRGTAPYYGVNGIQEHAWRREWLQQLGAGLLQSEWRDRDFVFSDESGLVRLGGRDALQRVAAAVDRTFTDPHVVLSVRDPASILVSAYFQSVAVRRRATGEGDGGRSYRFVKFPDWWAALKRGADVSLAGLLDYDHVVTTLARTLGEARVVVLPVEFTKRRPEVFVESLGRLQFPAPLVRSFLDHPPINSTHERRLRRSCGALMRLGRTAAWTDSELLGRLVYRGPEIDLVKRYPDVLADVRRTVGPYDAFLAKWLPPEPRARDEGAPAPMG